MSNLLDFLIPGKKCICSPQNEPKIHDAYPIPQMAQEPEVGEGCIVHIRYMRYYKVKITNLIHVH